uniref:vacuolar fusion protein MON1 homolog A-like isoform X2 n=1 Tax=Styela clava TaxID=7725 RepID=UPI00193A16A6|nr:vacuolar fusion protein MON1 homolog A-like isoform X2 [Styela clava]
MSVPSDTDEVAVTDARPSINGLEEIEPGATAENQSLVVSEELTTETKEWDENATDHHFTNAAGIKDLTRLMRSVSVKADEEKTKTPVHRAKSDSHKTVTRHPSGNSQLELDRQLSTTTAGSDYPDTSTASFNSDFENENFYSGVEQPKDLPVDESQVESEFVMNENWRMKERHVFVLTEAGKPVYTRHGNEDKLAPLMGVLLAIVSCVYDRKDILRYVVAGDHKFVFMPRPPLIFVGICSTKESVHQIQVQLTYIYNTIISVLTLSQLTKIYDTKKNFDLRRLLTGTDKFLNNLCKSMDSEPQFLLQAVQCLPVNGNVRDVIGQALQQAKTEDLAFALLISHNQIVNICRLKEHSLHPSDIHVILNIVNSSSSAFHAGESWTPICLPNFNSSGFLHAHISYLDEGCTTCLILLSADRDAFFTLSHSKSLVLQKLQRHDCLETLAQAGRVDTYSVRKVGISVLRHFIYKSKSTSQFTCPEIGHPYITEDKRKRIFSLYQHAHGRIHDGSCPLKLLYLVLETETILGWVTTGFELYAIFGPLVTKNSAIQAVNRLLRWIKKQEDELFILRPPIF